MQHTTEIKRPDGTKYKIHVSMYCGTFDNEMKYSVSVWKTEPGKRKEIQVLSTDNYSYRKLNMQERERYTNDLYLQHITADELYAAKIAAWESLKPKK